jgi:hypothetical protein
MKKNYLIAVLLAISFYSFAQENKNKFLINGNAHYSNYHQRDKYNLSESAYDYLSQQRMGGLNFGYFITNDFVIGISGAINRITGVADAGDKKNYFYKSSFTDDYTACGIFTRYNHALQGGKFGFFLQLNANYIKGNSTNMNSQQSPNSDLVTTKAYRKYSRINTNLNPGIIYFINSKFSVESSLGSIFYEIGKSKEDDTYFINKASGFGINFSLTTINMGLSYYFGGKKF